MDDSGDIVVPSDQEIPVPLNVEEARENVDPTQVDETSDFPDDSDVFEMVTEVKMDEPLADITERYFATYYRMNFPQEGQDICIRMHTNRICLISLAPSHAIFQKERKISKIDFQVTDKLNRADNVVSGKAKHGAQPLHESSKICTILCDDGESWVVRCGMNGKLTEANTDLLTNPELLGEPPHKGGYLAIVLPKLNDLVKLKKSLVTQQVYEEMMLRRRAARLANGINLDDRSNASLKRPSDDDLDDAGSKEKIIKSSHNL